MIKKLSGMVACILTFFAILAMTFFMMQTISLHILTNDLLAYISLFLILIGILLLWLCHKRNHGVMLVISIISSILISVAFTYAGCFLDKMHHTIENMVNQSDEVNVVSVITTKNSPIETIQDLEHKHIASVELGDYKTQLQALAQIDKEIDDYEHSKTTDYVKHIRRLLNEEVDAILLNESAHGLMYSFFPNFDNQVKIIKQYEFLKDHQNLMKSKDLSSEAFNVYITGMDTYGSLEKVSRSDVNLIVTINPKTHQILITGLPRDYYIPQTCQLNQKDKLTHTGMFGVDCTIQSVEQFMDIDLNYFARVNFSSLLDVVDAFDGIDVYSDYSFTTRYGNYEVFKGMNHFTGDQALGFVRERYEVPRGDLDRSVNQMRTLTAIIDKATSHEMIMRYSDVLEAISGCFQTNMTYDEVSKFVKGQVKNFNEWDIKHIQLTGEGATEWTPANGFYAYVMIPDDTAVKNAQYLINQVLQNHKLSDEDIKQHEQIVRP